MGSAGSLLAYRIGAQVALLPTAKAIVSFVVATGP